MSVYNKLFYDNQVNGSLDSARAVVPIIMNMVNPKSVIDVGCGLGTWLSVFIEMGVNDILGCDGDWVNQNRLLIHKDDFITTDLENPVEIEEKFDLAISLEVAEHISKENSEKFIEYLTDKSSVILFSAAIPFQGGANHINEQWPEYWIKIFKKNNYQVIDCIRGKIWGNEGIEFWYIQNIFLFVEKNYLQTNEKLQQLESSHISPYSIVHPRVYSYKIKLHNEIENNLKKVSLNELNSQKQNYENQIKKQEQIYQNQIRVKEKMLQEVISSNSWKITKHPRKLGSWLRNLKNPDNLFDGLNYKIPTIKANDKLIDHEEVKVTKDELYSMEIKHHQDNGSVESANSSFSKLENKEWAPYYLKLELMDYSKFFDVFTHLSILERLFLYKFALSLSENSILVEIGSYLGASSLFLAAAAKEINGTVFCVDTWYNNDMTEGVRDTFIEFTENTKDFETNIVPCRGRSEDVVKTFNKKIDLLFIDGDHSYEGVKTDIKYWFPKLNDDALVIFHDYGWSADVQRAVHELVKPLEKYEGKILDNIYYTNIE